VRERFYQTTRFNSEKWEKKAEIRGEKAFNSRFQAFLKGYVGRYPILGRAGGDCFGKQTPEKGLFFSINRGFWGCFSEVSVVCDGPKGPEVPKEPEVEEARE
jgi:hypothetical protein